MWRTVVPIAAVISPRHRPDVIDSQHGPTTLCCTLDPGHSEESALSAPVPRAVTEHDAQVVSARRATDAAAIPRHVKAQPIDLETTSALH